MKKLFILAAAIVAFASCSKNEEPTAMVPTREIQFVAGQAVTRAAVTDVVGENQLTERGFLVYGNMGTTQIFNGVEVQHKTKNNALVATNQATDGAWAPAKAADVKYWVEGQSYKFSGVWPLENSGYKMDENGKQTITSFDNTGTTDLVVSNVVVAPGAVAHTPVALTFNHMLSRIQFTFVNKFEGSELVTISDVKINGVPQTGSIEDWPTWIPSTEKETIAFGAMVGNFASTKIDTTSYKYIIPCNAENITVDFTVVVTDNGQEIAREEYKAKPLYSDYAGKVFAAGQSYNFTANIKPTTVGDIFPIEFNVTVTPWGKDTESVIPGFGE